MKAFFTGLYYSFPVQLVLLHFKRFQVLLVFWYLLFSTVGGKFMNSYGADSLFLAPEYLGEVNMASSMILGFAIAVLIMSWQHHYFHFIQPPFPFSRHHIKSFFKILH